MKEYTKFLVFLNSKILLNVASNVCVVMNIQQNFVSSSVQHSKGVVEALNKGPTMQESHSLGVQVMQRKVSEDV